MRISREYTLWFASVVFVLFGLKPAAALEPCQAPTAIAPSTQTQKESKTQSILSFAFRANSKGCDIISWLGTRGRTQEFQNPAELALVQVRSSSLAPDSSPPEALLSRQLLRFVTKPEQGSWVSFDFGPNLIRPSHYNLRHYSSWDTEALRNWVFEGSLDGKSWTLLREHTNDHALNGKGDSHTWALSGPNIQKAYQYFRIRQTGLNSNRHYYLALSGFEIYGELSTALLPGQFFYRSDFDTNGIVYHLGKIAGPVAFRNPSQTGKIKVSSSSLAPDSSPPGALLSRQLLRFTTKPEQESWVTFDFGANLIRPSHYTLRHYSSWDTEALRNWVLEGSLDGKSWTLLRKHTNDQALNGRGDSHTWALSGPNVQNAYRYFRIRQTGLNSNNHYYLALSGFEIYGRLK